MDLMIFLLVGFPLVTLLAASCIDYFYPVIAGKRVWRFK